jgi:hypothetical protein
MGRIDSGNIFSDAKARWPSGYILTLAPDGGWTLISTKHKVPVHTLASGTVKLSGQKWHRAELAFHGNQITATVDKH